MGSRVSLVNRRKFLTDNGYELLNYSGKMKDAPAALKHILRDFSDGGLFVINMANKTVFPIGHPPVGLVATAYDEWVVSEAFFEVVLHLLARRGWVLAAVYNGQVSSLDQRPDKRWEFNPDDYNQLAEGYYSINEKYLLGPHLTERDALEDAAIQEGIINGYFNPNPEKVGQPFTGKLRPVVVSDNMVNLMTDWNSSLAVVMNAPALGDPKATARMLALSPEMFKLVNFIVGTANGGIKDFNAFVEQVVAAADAIQTVFEGYEA